MNQDLATQLLAYWSPEEVRVNGIVFANLVGALLLGALVGYERAYRGRAAGMRTYGLVCMAAAGLTVVAGQPTHWFGGVQNGFVAADPTRVVQGIVTGIGFLGAGVIVKEGLNISGLTTAASIWSASCIGVLVGVGFYAAAILLSGLSAAVMFWGARIEERLPSHPALRVVLKLRGTLSAAQAGLESRLSALGYGIAPGSFSVTTGHDGDEAAFVIVAADRRCAAALPALADALRALPELESLSLHHARN